MLSIPVSTIGLPLAFGMILLPIYALVRLFEDAPQLALRSVASWDGRARNIRESDCRRGTRRRGGMNKSSALPLTPPSEA